MNFVLETRDFVSKTRDFALNMMNFVLETRDFVSKTRDFALNMMNFAGKTKPGANGRVTMDDVIKSGDSDGDGERSGNTM